jgi:hypothetical protein
MAVQRPEEALKFFNANDVAELDVDTSWPKVLLTSHFAKGQKFATGRRRRRYAFLFVASMLSGAMAFVIVGAAHLLADSKPQQVLGQALGPHPFLSTYLIVGGIAAGLTALLTWRSRPDLARSANGYLQEWVEAGREAVIVGVGLALVVYFWHPNSLGHPFSRGTILLTVPLLAAALGAVRGGVRFVAARFA